ncbi:MAG: hypothetical protein B7Z55_15200 [Planctomycetales bacterium 12-60-4]|nr:MAG: hypothetical protein B7Z55_15200 [Planctomycetales bacterium 12-60-4]
MILRCGIDEHPGGCRNALQGTTMTARLSRLCALWLAVLCCGGSFRSFANDDVPSTEHEQAKPAKELFRGAVVLVTDALKQRGLKAYPEELKGQVALETADGELLPILPDWRGRAFYQDERLRRRKVELIGFRRPGIPFLQVLTIYTFDKVGQRQYTDYWCDICSIPMYEIKPCDCCQQDIRLRFQPQELPADLRDESTAQADGEK